MRRYDKIFAGLILVAMIGFWVVIAPAAFVARTSEALPLNLSEDAAVDDRDSAIPKLTERQKRSRANARNADARIKQLKIRNRDTPSQGQRVSPDDVATPLPMPTGDNANLQSIEDAPNLPVYY